jgi:uncharacterized protein YcbX
VLTAELTATFGVGACRVEQSRRPKYVKRRAARAWFGGFSLAISLKSMQGEELTTAEVTERGLLGDRAYALVDSSDGKAATAKNPRKWPHLFDFRATFGEQPRSAAKVAPVRIVLPDGTTVTSDQRDLRQILSKALNREVTFRAAQPGAVNAEEYWPDMDGLDHRDTVTDFTLPEGTFFDVAMVHLLTTATLDRLRELYPQGRFEVRRFRPNIVVQLAAGEKGFAENAWVGHTLALGEAPGLLGVRAQNPDGLT